MKKGDTRLQGALLYLALVVLALEVVATAQSLDEPPSWAFTVAGHDYKQPVDDGTVRHVPNSTAGWTLTQLRDLFFAPDWHPEEHPPMPEVVARGRKPDVYACGFCRRADGPGGPENAGLANEVPKTYVAGWVFSPVNDKVKELIGSRIIEMPKDLEQFESRDTRSEFIAYVPVGKHCERRSASDYWWQRQDASVRKMSRKRFTRAWADTGDCGTFAELSYAANL